MIRTIADGGRYAFRFLTHKLDAFQAFGHLEEGRLPHSVIRPVPTYSPWRADAEFIASFKHVRPNTLVDLYRAYELWSLAQEVAKLQSGDFLEVGVWRGGTGALIAKRAQLDQVDATVYLCDTFSGVVKAGDRDPHYDGGEHSNTTEGTVLDLLSKMRLKNVLILKGIFPDETAGKIEGRKFRYCHIDVDVYESGKAVLDWVWPRLVVGGIVVFDDYGCLSTGGITELVNNERRKQDRLMVHNLNGHAVFFKLP